jgi:hypothetical protein
MPALYIKRDFNQMGKISGFVVDIVCISLHTFLNVVHAKVPRLSLIRHAARLDLVERTRELL